LLGFGRRDVADGLQERSVVDAVHPFQRCELYELEAAQRPRRWITSAFVQTVDGFEESVVIGISDAVGTRLHVSFS